MKRGKLIVFEGISGTGKETQAKLLQEYLVSRGINSQIVYHPSTDLKDILSIWRSERNIHALTEIYLLLADRSSCVNQTIIPALERGEWVISLRSWISALVYQGETQEFRRMIREEFGRFEPKPDYLFYFDIDPTIAYDRARDRHNRTGEPMGKFETPENLTDMRSRYLTVMKSMPHSTVNALAVIDEIHRKIIKFF
jgi:dTMP kinase